MQRGLVLRARCPHGSGSAGGPRSRSLGSAAPSADGPRGTAVVLQEKQLVARLAKQLQAETEQIEVVRRGEGSGLPAPGLGTCRRAAGDTGAHAFVCQVLRQEKQRLQEQREELETQSAW